MKAVIKILIFLFVIGLIMAVSGFFLGLNIQSLSSFFNDDASYGEELRYDLVEDDIDKIVMKLDRRHIQYVLTDEETLSITYHAKDDDTWTFDIEDGVFTVEQKERHGIRNWFNYKYVTKAIITLTVYVPNDWVIELDFNTGTGEINLNTEEEKTFLDVKLVSGTGNIRVSRATMKSLTVTVSTGNVTLNDLTMDEEFRVVTSTGNQNINRIVVLDETTLRSSTGQINVTDLTTEKLTMTNSTGRIFVNESSIQNELSAITSTGDVKVSLTTANSYVLRASTGNVTFSVEDLSLYQFSLRASTGKVTVDGSNQGTIYNGGSGSIPVSIIVSTGNVNVE